VEKLGSGDLSTSQLLDFSERRLTRLKIWKLEPKEIDSICKEANSENVKTVTKQISLSEELANFAAAEAEEGGYGSISGYFADLVRQRRQQQIEADLKLLSAGISTAPAESEPVEEIVSLTKKIRRQMRQERWTP
jgi:hypothetical protein